MTLVTVQSANRPYRVEAMNAAAAPLSLVWYVPSDQAVHYEAAGANVRPVDGDMPMKSKQLNAALRDGFDRGETVVTMDDDFVSVSRLSIVDGKHRAVKMTLAELVTEMVELTERSGFMLGGTPGSTNPLWANPKPMSYGMVWGQMLIHLPNPIRFDEELGMLEDLDLIIQHHKVFGGIYKDRSYMPEFHIFGRSEAGDSLYDGGYKNYRTEKLQGETLAILSMKHHEVVFEDLGLGKSVQKRVNFRQLASEAQSRMNGGGK